MGMTVRRILCNGHVFFHLEDLANYLDIGDFPHKVQKTGLVPVVLPLPEGMVKPSDSTTEQHLWLLWDDLYKMDQRYKWRGAEAGRKLSNIRMWARNREGLEPYVLVGDQLKKHQVASQQITITDKPIEKGESLMQKPTSIVSVEEPKPVTPQTMDLQFGLMAFVENIQVESLKERREMMSEMREQREQMVDLVRSEQALSQAISRNLTDLAKHMFDKMYYPSAMNVDCSLPASIDNGDAITTEVEQPEQTFAVDTQSQDMPVVEQVVAPPEETPVTQKKKAKRRYKRWYTYTGPPAKDPHPGQPMIIGRDDRTGRWVRAQVGPGYTTSKLTLEKHGKDPHNGYWVHKLSQRAFHVAMKERRGKQLYHVPIPQGFLTRGKTPNTNNEAAWPIDIAERVFATLEFDEFPERGQ